MSDQEAGSVIGLFAGIGGIELGFEQAGYKAKLLCEIDDAAQTVLRKRHESADMYADITKLKALPRCDVVTAGFPCTDLSPAGRSKGINGNASGLIKHVFRLLRKTKYLSEWLLLENVPFMLYLQGGAGIKCIVDELDQNGWKWAYRVVDARSFGLPQRRRRVLILASKRNDPRAPLLGQDTENWIDSTHSSAASGFYWTEGNRGLGWAVNAIPTLKGSSGLNIPSPPAIWFPKRRSILLPSIRDAERLQGLPSDWTKPAENLHHGERARWRLVGNAVPAPMAKWLAERLTTNTHYCSRNDQKFSDNDRWPTAAWGHKGNRYRADLSECPVKYNYQHLATFLRHPLKPISQRAAAGFLTRLLNSRLRIPDMDFVTQLGRISGIKNAKKIAQARHIGNISTNAGEKTTRQRIRNRAALKAA